MASRKKYPSTFVIPAAAKMTRRRFRELGQAADNVAMAAQAFTQRQTVGSAHHLAAWAKIVAEEFAALAEQFPLDTH
jgi:hypothetical protein